MSDIYLSTGTIGSQNGSQKIRDVSASVVSVCEISNGSIAQRLEQGSHKPITLLDSGLGAINNATFSREFPEQKGDLGTSSSQSEYTSPCSIETYFIRGKTGGPIKIGKAKNPHSRLKDLQIGSPVILELLGTLPGDREEELHEEFRASHSHGEWFYPTFDLIAFLAKRFPKMAFRDEALSELDELFIRRYGVTLHWIENEWYSSLAADIGCGIAPPREAFDRIELPNDLDDDEIAIVDAAIRGSMDWKPPQIDRLVLHDILHNRRDFTLPAHISPRPVAGQNGGGK